MKASGRKIAMLTAYDFTSAALVDAAGIDAVLVGDSLAMVMLGHDSTLPVTIDEMVLFTRAVTRGVKRALVVADMPFGSYQASMESGVRNAIRLLQEGGAQAVKLEGGRAFAPLVAALVTAGVPVMGHVGLTPQWVHQMGGYRVQGRTPWQASVIVDDARSLQQAGAFSIVVECVPSEVGAEIAQACQIPIIGIGAGADCDGQVLVLQDMLGMSTGRVPRFVKRYADMAAEATRAVTDYIDDVRETRFPGPEHGYGPLKPPPSSEGWP